MQDTPQFIKGMELCRSFFLDCAKDIIETRFPDLPYSAGLIGYGSDVLGFDDAVSTDHMWGPRFYLFLRKEDIALRDAVFRELSEKLPCAYRGFSVNFTPPDPDDCGVQHPAPVQEGPVNPLVFIQTFEGFLLEQLGTADLDHLSPFEWLAFSEHRLLSLVSGRLFVDGLNCARLLEKIRFYPNDVKLYLIASNWDCIASEQAFVKRCGQCGDELGSRIICTRLCERLMRLCFLYTDTYAPYSKWFGTAFQKLPVSGQLKEDISGALSANDLAEREDKLVSAQAAVAELHNTSGLTCAVDYSIESYYGRDIKVIFAEKFAQAAGKKLAGTALEGVPLIGTFSQTGALAALADEITYRQQIADFYIASQSQISEVLS